MDDTRQPLLKLMRYANGLTPYKLDEPLDPMVSAAVDAWISENIATKLAQQAKAYGGCTKCQLCPEHRHDVE
jgi:hypothetical protein